MWLLKSDDKLSVDMLLLPIFAMVISILLLYYLIVAVCTVLSYPSIGLGREAEGGLVLAEEECQGARRGLVERGGGDT